MRSRYGYASSDRPRDVAGSIGPGTKFPTLGQISFADLRDVYEEGRLTDSSRVGWTSLSSRSSFDLLAAKAAMIGSRRGERGRLGRTVPLQVPGDGRAHWPDAARD